MNASANAVAGALLPGTRLLEYKIEHVLGTGGFGITYAARDPHLDKTVAIKEYLPAELAVRSDATTVSVRSESQRAAFAWGREQFMKEARLVARFNHPNLIHVYRFFEANDTAYFVMEYAEGTTLEEILKRQGTLSEQAIKSILMPVLDGLREVHRARILHRDIKPSNIIIRRDGSPVLIDFGSARQNVGSMTRSIMSVVTSGYAPIEQYAVDGHQGPWTDIYAMGAVAYRALSGKRPLDSVSRIRRDPMTPAVAAGAGRYSPHFLRAVDWSLMVNPEDRPVGISDWRQALEGSLAPPRREGVSHPTSAPPWPVAVDTPGIDETQLVEDGATPAPTMRVGGVDSMRLRGSNIDETRVVSLSNVGIPPAAPPPPHVPEPEDRTVPTGTVIVGEAQARRRQYVWSVIGVAAVAGLVTIAALDPGRLGLDNTGSFDPGPVKVRKPVRVAEASSSAADAPVDAPLDARTPVAAMAPLSVFRDCEQCPTMVVLPRGTFLMGSPAEPGIDAAERPAHRVTINHGVALARFETTLGQWKACVEAGACPSLGGAGEGDDRAPVTSARYGDARAYAVWLSGLTGRRYRLPTEAEWEFAARAGGTSAYFWGATLGASQCAYANGAPLPPAAAGEAPACNDPHEQRAPVGSYLANAFGLHDMAGNVREWTLDCWASGYDHAPEDGTAFDALGCQQRVVRGGGWRSPPVELRSAARAWRDADSRADDLGFRLAAD